MGVIVGPQRGDTGMMERFLMDWMDRKEQRKQHKSTLEQQESQFGRTLDLNTRDTESAIDLRNTQKSAVQEAEARATALKKMEDFGNRVLVPLEKNGRRAEAEQARTRFFADNPDVGRYAAQYVENLGNLDTDRAAANTAKFSADQTGIAASGAPDAQARAFTQEAALGRGMSAHQFGDQVQRQGSPDAYNQYVEREGGARVTAGQQLQADTNVKTTAMNIAGQKDIAGMRIDGAGGTGGAGGLSAGTQTKVAAVNAGINVIDQISNALDAYNSIDMMKDPQKKLMAGLQLKALIKGGAPMIARTMGEVGNLSKDEQAAARTLASPGLLATTAWPELASQRIQILRGVAERTKQGLMATGDGMAGSGQQLDDATAKQILEQAGGDPNKARELARSLGFSF